MSGKDLHNEPFTEETITKLEIFAIYAREWIPTFVMSGAQTINIYDFFAGTGYDKIGVPGSTIRILEEIKKQIGNIFEHKTSVNVFINEYVKNKFDKLEEACNNFMKDNPEMGRAGVKLNLYNKKFEVLYDELESSIGIVPSLVYLDQNGVKFTSDKYFLNISAKPHTDFLYYVSSSYFLRFGNTPEFKKHLNVDLEQIKNKPYKFVHQEILSYLRGRLPKNSKTKLYPFTIKKQSNVYGIIFGASHPRAVDKFLKTGWKINTVNGSANFDIDEDSEKQQLDLFAEQQPLTKIEAFQKKLSEKIKSGEIKNNKEAYLFTIEEGHIGSHASTVISKMKKEGTIIYKERSPKVNYESAIQKSDIVDYKIVKK